MKNKGTKLVKEKERCEKDRIEAGSVRKRHRRIERTTHL